MEKYRTIIGLQKITIPRIAILGMLLTLLMGLKYVFGFVMGIEFITFSFIFLGIFLPIIDLSLLIASFNILILCIYGFGPWWIAYWIIWPIDAFISKVISKITKNRYAFATWGFFAGTMTFVWYYFLNLSFYGESMAFLNLLTSIPTNVMQGAITLFACVIFSPKLATIFNGANKNIWPNLENWNFSKTKNRNKNLMTTVIIAMSSIVIIITMFMIGS